MKAQHATTTMMTMTTTEATHNILCAVSRVVVAADGTVVAKVVGQFDALPCFDW
jgi:hypothetical protein